MRKAFSPSLDNVLAQRDGQFTPGGCPSMLTWADMYDQCDMAAKKMIVARLILIPL